MSVSIARRHAGSALIAVGAALAAVLALVVPAAASTGTQEISPEQAGYTATGAQFQTITATVFLRGIPSTRARWPTSGRASSCGPLAWWSPSA